MINTERANQGLPPLAGNGILGGAARSHSTDMAVNNFLGHNSSDGTTFDVRITNAGYSYSTIAENVAAGYGTPADVVAGWMGSSGHYANIMGPYTEIGVGYAYCSGSDYGSYWTTDFGSP